MINEEFIKLYNELDSFIEEKYERYEEDSSIYFLINKFRKSDNSLEREYSKKLDSIRKIRNLYVHENGIIDELFIVSEEVVKTLKEILVYVKNPLVSKDVMTPFSQLKYLTYESKLEDGIDIIFKDGISNVPILSNEKNVIGIFNGDVLVLAYKKDIKLFDDTRLKDMKELVSLECNFNSRFIFVNENYEIDVLNDYFRKSKEEHKKKLPVIFVTSNGKMNGSLKGVISPIDLVKNKANSLRTPKIIPIRLEEYEDFTRTKKDDY